MLSKLIVTLSVLGCLIGARFVQAEEIAGTSSEKYYTFRVGKIRMKDSHNTPSITNEIRDAYMIRFLIPSRDVNEEHPFYSFEEGFGKWCMEHLDLHIGTTRQSNPSLYLIGGNCEITKFVDLVAGVAFSNEVAYRNIMYYAGITFDSQLFHHIIDVIQKGIQAAEK